MTQPAAFGNAVTVTPALQGPPGASVVGRVRITSAQVLQAGALNLIDTSGGSFTGTMPTPVDGTVVGVVDYAGSFAAHPLTVAQSGSETIANPASRGSYAASVSAAVAGATIWWVYIGSVGKWVALSW